MLRILPSLLLVGASLASVVGEVLPGNHGLVLSVCLCPNTMSRAKGDNARCGMDRTRKGKGEQGASLPLLTVGLFVAIAFCALIFHQACTIASVSIGFSLCFLLFWSHPMASKEGTFPLSCCSYKIIKNRPDPIPVRAPQRAKICHSLRFSERESPPSSLVRELSLDPHIIRMLQNAHHLPEQLQKTGIWCPIG